MKYLKSISLGLLAVAIISIIIAAVYGSIYWHKKTLNEKQTYETFTPSVTVDENACKFVPSDERQNWSLTLEAKDPQKVQANITESIRSLGGTISSSSSSNNEEDPYGDNGVYLNFTAPLANSTQIVDGVKKSAAANVSIKSEALTVDDSEYMTQNCESNLLALKSYRSQELLYLEQFRKNGASDELLAGLSQVRQDASYYQSSMTSNRTGINKLSGNVTIRLEE